MGWDRLLNQGGVAIDVRYTQTLWEWLTFKLAHGHSITMSGDGLLLHSGVGSVLTGYSAIDTAGHLSNRFAWFVEESPDGSQWCWQHDPSSMGYSYWKPMVVMPGKTPFSGGNATTRASSVDEVCPTGDAAPPAQGYSFISGWNPYYHFIEADADVNGVRASFMFADHGLTFPGYNSLVVGMFAPLVIDPGDTCPGMTIHTKGGSLNTVDWRSLTSKVKGCYHNHGGGTETWAQPASGWMQESSGICGYPTKTDPGLHSGKYHSILTSMFTSIALEQTFKGVYPIAYRSAKYTAGFNNNDLWVDQNGECYVDLYAPTSNGGLMLPGWDPTVLCLPDLGGGLTVNDLYIDGLPVTPDTTPPTISIVSPTVGGPITAGQPIVVDVTDDIGLGLVVLTVEQGSAHEVVWLRDAFASAYSDGSTRAAIAGGYRYTVQRRGGWISSPIFHVEAIDLGGNLGA